MAIRAHLPSAETWDSTAPTNRDTRRKRPTHPPGKRERSTIEFPYLDLDAAVEVAQGVHQVAGSSCGWDQLAAQMGQTAKGGGFRLRVMTAKTFGFVTYGQGTVTLTDLGQRLNDPQQEKVAATYGFTPSPARLDHVRLASLRIAGGCSASFISPQGLVMTNHHCVVDCVEQLSTPQQNFVDTGFAAKTP